MSFLLSFRLNFLLQPCSTNPYSNMNMLTSPFDQALVMISQIQQLSRSNGWRICSTTNSECLLIVIPSERSKHATSYQDIQTTIEQFQLSSTSRHISLNWQNLSNGKRFHKGAQTNKSQNFHIAPVLRWQRIINLCLWFLLLANSILNVKSV